MIEAIARGILTGAASFLWCRVLTAPGMAAAFVPRLYWRVIGNSTPTPMWKVALAKPLFDCPVCNSFWLALVDVLIISGSGHVFEFFVAAVFSAYFLDQKLG